MPANPAITVAAITESAGRFLLVEERIAARLVLNQPAGHVEPGETLAQAIVREVREETAWRFTPSEFLGAYRHRHPDTGRDTLRFAFIGAISDHDPEQPLDTGIIRTCWLTRRELMQSELQLRSPLVLRCVEDYVRGRRAPLDAVAGLDICTACTVDAARS